MNNDCVVIKYVISGACANVVVTFERGHVRGVSFTIIPPYALQTRKCIEIHCGELSVCERAGYVNSPDVSRFRFEVLMYVSKCGWFS